MREFIISFAFYVKNKPILFKLVKWILAYFPNFESKLKRLIFNNLAKKTIKNRVVCNEDELIFLKKIKSEIENEKKRKL